MFPGVGGRTGLGLITHLFHEQFLVEDYGEEHPEYYALVEKASVGAYRLALGEYFKNEKPVPADEREANRDLARTLFHLTDTHNVAEYFEGRRMEGAKQNIRKALGMADDEAF